MTSLLREEGIGQNVTIVLIGCLNRTVTRWRGAKNPKILLKSFKYRNVQLFLSRDINVEEG